MSKSLIERNPFRPKSALFSIYEVLARSQKPLDVEEVAKRAKVPLGRTTRMLAAMGNYYHNSGMRRVGTSIERKDGLLTLKSVKADAKAHRPERGKSKGNKKSRKPAKGKHQSGKKKPNAQAVKAKFPAVVAKADALNEREKLVLSTLNAAPKPVDEIIAETKLKPEEVLATLLVLEVRRLARQHPGKLYSKSETK